MKVVVVNCFDTYGERVGLIKEFFENKSFQVTVLQSNFSHFNKEYLNKEEINYQYIHTTKYNSNLSYARLKSHYNFAENSYKVIEQIKPDILYVVIPPNSLARIAKKYKMKYKNTKIIFDIIDLWPETLPVNKIKGLPPFTTWRKLRDNNIKYADLIITECNLYRKALGKLLEQSKVETIYLAKKEIDIKSSPRLSEEEIHLSYLGSINNIIDIKKIKDMIYEINKLKPVTLHIIGDGESKNLFIKEIEKTGSKVIFYGKVYNNKIKQEIFDQCHYGLNIMKESVCVGLTMKSIDYFQMGLPILNNIQEDTEYIVSEHDIGFNVTDGNFKKLAELVNSTSVKDNLAMRKNTYKTFFELFSVNAFGEKLENAYTAMGIQN
ncbi:glycosyltransferase involved in cell wall biosynthesis [Alkalihalobacillus xiaoxiensis]|uniref:Glycosyltransferase involved in cell wall biosynthesis n=1 Tax=Shouchella xiaoxiensis TaxID=766895 RepID=A0ABS2SVA7_9BACI|nr:glycosyltransferase [Shouchella xiaoxiensis]MBM7839414.1 glycosyltransferase involved in cell wall biosynthesis [Shouchella xiaoxiensis]